jgi:hypothetical protein
LHDGGSRFKSDAEEDRHSVADSTLNAPGAVGRCGLFFL